MTDVETMITALRFGSHDLLSPEIRNWKTIQDYITLDNGVMKSPKRREIISLIFTCLCTTKSLLIKLNQFENNQIEFETKY